MMKRRLFFIGGPLMAFLFLIRAHQIGAHGTVDQDTLAPSQSDEGFCTSQLPVGQTFVPQATTLVGFDIALNGRLGGGILDVEVRHWPAGPAGPVLSSVRASVVPGPNHVDLPAAVPLTPGTKYVVLVTRAQLAAIPAVAQHLRLPEARVYGAVTFYSEFRETPPPETLVSWCSGHACSIKGGAGIRLVLEKLLGCGLGENTPDNRLGLHLGQCNGTCDNAPQVWVNGRVVGPLTPAKAVELVKELKGER